jgi:hypothetical protein
MREASRILPICLFVSFAVVAASGPVDSVIATHIITVSPLAIVRRAASARAQEALPFGTPRGSGGQSASNADAQILPACRELLRRRLDAVRALGGLFQNITAGPALTCDPSSPPPNRRARTTNRVGPGPGRQGRQTGTGK